MSNRGPRIWALALAVGGVGMTPAQSFSRDEVEKIRTFWAQPGRYTISDPDRLAQVGRWQVRLSVAGSTWLWNYNRVRGMGKVAPTVDASPQNAEQRDWETWINARVAFDRAQAALGARRRNVEELQLAVPALAEAPDPGSAPEGLVALNGPVPPFAEPVRVQQHRIRFDDSEHRFHDNPPMRPRFAFYRFPEGVMDGGTAMRQLPDSEIGELLTRAGIDASERRVFAAVSLLEGGFDSVNTYDTGFVSVGFIQFASLRAGSGSLGQVLLTQKKDDALSFESDFRRFGLDVTDSGQLVALDLATGQVAVGPEANAQIIRDKRLIAVFQRAGRRSAPHRVAQLRVAKAMYYPADDTVLLTVSGRAITGRVREVIRSEAGMATLMDRKVNTGTIEILGRTLQSIATRERITEFAELAAFELEVVRAIRYRKDYLQDSTLSQPVQKPDTPTENPPNFPPPLPR